ncbi:PREDICTED: uncharacterized protein LOC109164955 isoform X2 [Ipomoea nil]|uniref:uncharacterized protein LOC109164955 isoform X2 n=1 Tax=Ipomoea nil TaxID=35883 RepID=UPI000900BB9E|nr:PREDICTED: uncharacterized protein LOC109164955 isoform X2 [Ipomoea nil]
MRVVGFLMHFSYRSSGALSLSINSQRHHQHTGGALSLSINFLSPLFSDIPHTSTSSRIGCFKAILPQVLPAYVLRRALRQFTKSGVLQPALLDMEASTGSFGYGSFGSHTSRKEYGSCSSLIEAPCSLHHCYSVVESIPLSF